jgi:hypothetical protein
MPETTAPGEFREDLTLQVPLSELYRFNKAEETKELLGIYKEGPPKKTTLAPAKRFIVSTIGIFCLMLGLTGLFGNKPNIFSFLWIILGGAIIWVFLAKPEMDKRRSAASPGTGKDPEASLTFTGSGIVIRRPDSELTRDWPELIDYKKIKRGVHLYFVDGIEMWLPITAFYGDEMKVLMELIQRKIRVKG